MTDGSKAAIGERSTVHGNAVAVFDGGGILVSGLGSLNISDTFISSNNASVGQGGGIAVSGRSAVSFLNVSFVKNNARSGGGLHGGSGVQLFLVGCLFSENVGSNGSGVSVSNGGVCNLAGSRFMRNTAALQVSYTRQNVFFSFV